MDLPELLREYFKLSQVTSEVVASTIVFLSAFAAGWITYFVFKRYLNSWAVKTKTKLDDMILRNVKAPIIFSAILIGAHYGLAILSFLEAYRSLLAASFTVAEVLVVTLIVVRVISVLSSWYSEKTAKQGRRISEHVFYVLTKSVQAAVYVFAFLVILLAFEIDLSGVVVGLGVGGLAVALAMQNVLSDVFSAFSIYFDRPFEVGDLIVVGEYQGTVKKIGIKSTRLRLLQGEELVISNKELTQTTVRNFRKLRKRRVSFTLNVSPETPVEKLEEIPRILARIMGEIDQVEFERAHMKMFGDFSHVFEVVYNLKTSNYLKYMDTRQAINFAIIRAFEKESIQMPIPTQAILIKKDG